MATTLSGDSKNVFKGFEGKLLGTLNDDQVKALQVLKESLGYNYQEILDIFKVSNTSDIKNLIHGVNGVDGSDLVEVYRGIKYGTINQEDVEKVMNGTSKVNITEQKVEQLVDIVKPVQQPEATLQSGQNYSPIPDAANNDSSVQAEFMQRDMSLKDIHDSDLTAIKTKLDEEFKVLKDVDSHLSEDFSKMRADFDAMYNQLNEVDTAVTGFQAASDITVTNLNELTENFGSKIDELEKSAKAFQEGINEKLEKLAENDEIAMALAATAVCVVGLIALCYAIRESCQAYKNSITDKSNGDQDRVVEETKEEDVRESGSSKKSFFDRFKIMGSSEPVLISKKVLTEEETEKLAVGNTSGALESDRKKSTKDRAVQEVKEEGRIGVRKVKSETDLSQVTKVDADIDLHGKRISPSQSSGQNVSNIKKSKSKPDLSQITKVNQQHDLKENLKSGIEPLIRNQARFEESIFRTDARQRIEPQSNEKDIKADVDEIEKEAKEDSMSAFGSSKKSFFDRFKRSSSEPVLISKKVLTEEETEKLAVGSASAELELDRKKSTRDRVEQELKEDNVRESRSSEKGFFDSLIDSFTARFKKGNGYILPKIELKKPEDNIADEDFSSQFDTDIIYSQQQNSNTLPSSVMDEVMVQSNLVSIKQESDLDISDPVELQVENLSYMSDLSYIADAFETITQRVESARALESESEEMQERESFSIETEHNISSETTVNTGQRLETIEEEQDCEEEYNDAICDGIAGSELGENSIDNLSKQQKRESFNVETVHDVSPEIRRIDSYAKSIDNVQSKASLDRQSVAEIVARLEKRDVAEVSVSSNIVDEMRAQLERSNLTGRCAPSSFVTGVSTEQGLMQECAR